MIVIWTYLYLRYVQINNMLQTVATLQVPARKESTIRLYEAVRLEYDRLINIKKNGFAFYHPDQVLAMVALKFFKSPKTIENIVYYRV